jgi:Uma2 family endonuclease
MGDAAKRHATYDDLLAVPEPLIGEILNGELVTQPRPATRHARASSRLGGALDGPFDRGKGGPGGWVILYEPELHLSADVVVPDFAGWRRERMPRIPLDAAALDLAPDWVGEILSPRTAVRDRTQKPVIYAREGVRHLWLLDPGLQTLETFTLAGAAYQVGPAWHGSAAVRAVPFEAIELDLGELWAE